MNGNLQNCIKVISRAIKSDEPTCAASLLPQRTIADFFSGIGLMRLGFQKQGWSCLFSNDIDPLKYEMYKDNFPNAEKHYLIDDIHKLSIDKVPSVTLATASFPCTDLSLAGARKGLEGKQSSAFWGFIRVVREMGDRKPPMVMLENVTGFLTSNQGDDFRRALLSLNELGYVVDGFTLDAKYFVPQSRPRLFVIGVLDDLLSSLKMPEDVAPSILRPKILTDFIAKHPEIKWHMQPLPHPETADLSLKDIIENLPANHPQWWNKERARYLLDQMSDRHVLVAQKMIKGSKWSYGTAFRRMRHGRSMAELRTDGKAGCLRTPKGGSARQILFKAGKGKYFARLITPKEAARLMGAGEYKINTSLNQALFGFGDAVCVSAIEWIAKYYMNPLVSSLIRQKPIRETQNAR